MIKFAKTIVYSGNSYKWVNQLPQLPPISRTPLPGASKNYARGVTEALNFQALGNRPGIFDMFLPPVLLKTCLSAAEVC